METKMQRFSDETEEMKSGGDGVTNSDPIGGQADEAEQKRRSFQELIQGEYREAFEEAVGQRIQAAIQQRFRRQEAEARPVRQAQDNPALRRHFRELTRQAEALKRVFPDFDLMREMQDPAFVRLTAPGTGIGVKDAFYALHGEEIQRDSMRYAALQAGQRIADSVRAGASRPVENGMQTPSPVRMGVDIRNMDKKQREEYRRRIRSGESIDFINRM